MRAGSSLGRHMSACPSYNCRRILALIYCTESRISSLGRLSLIARRPFIEGSQLISGATKKFFCWGKAIAAAISQISSSRSNHPPVVCGSLCVRLCTEGARFSRHGQLGRTRNTSLVRRCAAFLARDDISGPFLVSSQIQKHLGHPFQLRRIHRDVPPD